MAVKTKISEKDFAQILSSYDLGNFKDTQPISKGSVQTNYLIQTSKGKFVFRYYENRSKESVLFEANLIKYLNDKKYLCPLIQENKNGDYVEVYKDKPFVLFEFIEGEHLKNPNESQKKQLIQKVAELQNVTKDFDSPYKQYRWNYNIELCKELAKKETEKLNTDYAREKLKWYLLELSNINLPESLPKGICHCDFHFSNILFENGQFKALIDFDDANYTYLTYDLATLINPFIPSFDWNSWSNFRKEDDVFDFTEAKKVVTEYIKHREVNEEEMKYLIDVFKLSIMLDCVWYFGRGDASDFYEKRKIDYLNKLGRDKFYNSIFM